jgi:FkbM family methyltransferase
MSVVERIAAAMPAPLFARAIAVAQRRFEPEMGEIVGSCDPDGVAVDAGAWFGPWSFWLSRRVEQVVAFEANPDVAARLRSTMAPNVTVHGVALSDRAGTMPLSITGHGIGSEGRSSLRELPDATRQVVVPTRTLDSFELERVRLLKVDVEGHELEALTGSQQTIEAWHPLLVVELEERYRPVGPPIELLSSMGYEGAVKANGRWCPLSEFDLVASQRAAAADHRDRGYLRTVVGRRPALVNNVVFTHAETTWAPWRPAPRRR